MLRFCIAALLPVVSLGWGSRLPAQGINSPLIPRATANRYGLERVWYAQSQIDSAHSQVASVTLADGALWVQSDQGHLQAFDAETGEVQWSMQIGDRRHPSMPPAVDRKYVAVTNGTRLYVLNRSTGEFLWERSLGGTPGGAAALTEERVYVPLRNGLVEGYSLEENTRPKSTFTAAGRATVQPSVSGESLAWATSKGHFYVARSTDPGVRFRLEATGQIEAPAVYQKPYFFVASTGGFVYAMHELTGKQAWRYATGNPIWESPVRVGDRLFVCADRNGMYCLSTKTGQEEWWAALAGKFLAASSEHLYVSDGQSRLFILNAESGARIGTIPLNNVAHFVANNQTDRIYLVSNSGLVQCLRETAQVEPIQHVKPEAPAPVAAPKVAPVRRPAGDDPDAEDAEAGDAEDPDAAMPADDAEMPADDAEAPAEDAAEPAEEGDSPFE